MGLLQLSVVLSAALALASEWAGERARRWLAWWPIPLMAFGAWLGVTDLVALVTGYRTGMTAASVMLGVLAALTINFAGWMEIVAGRGRATEGRLLLAPALIIAAGCAMLLPAPGWEPGASISFASAVLTVLAGVVMLGARVHSGPGSWVWRLWPVALLVAVVVDRAPPADPLAEAHRELATITARLERDGWQVERIETPHAAGSPGGPTEAFRVNGNEVRVYLLADAPGSAAEVHLPPGLIVPPPSHGVPHLHASRHLVVVCLTTDWRFAQRLDALVRELGAHQGRARRALAGGAQVHTRALVTWRCGATMDLPPHAGSFLARSRAAAESTRSVQRRSGDGKRYATSLVAFVPSGHTTVIPANAVSGGGSRSAV